MLYEKGKKKDTRKEGGNVDKSATEVTAPWQCGTRFWTKQKIPHPLSTCQMHNLWTIFFPHLGKIIDEPWEKKYKHSQVLLLIKAKDRVVLISKKPPDN